jgi:hypothetical protein
LPKQTARCLQGVLPNLETLRAGGPVHHKVPNIEKIQLTFRSYLTITLVEAVSLELDVRQCISGFTVKIPYFISALMPCLLAVANVDLILDFKLVIGSIPSWMSPYLSVPTGCNHQIQMTIKVQCSQPRYMAFTHAIRFLVTDAQYTCLEWASIYLIYLIYPSIFNLNHL